MLTCEQAIMRAVEGINERCAAEGVPPLTGHDIPVLAACRVMDPMYDRARAKVQPGQEEQFDQEAVAAARILICRAILAPHHTRQQIAAGIA